MRAALLSVALILCLAAPALAQVNSYQLRPGDAFKTQTGAYRSGNPATCWQEFTGSSGGQITFSNTCDDGFRGLLVIDTNGNLVRRDTKMSIAPRKMIATSALERSKSHSPS
jgi:hypothetical protein